MKTYEIFWDEQVTYRAVVFAESEEEALEVFENGEYDDFEQVDSDNMTPPEVYEIED